MHECSTTPFLILEQMYAWVMPRGPLLHADADAFFASVALRSRPEDVNRPLVTAAHVIVTCANYPARALGIHAAMLVGEAQRLCPDLVVVDVPRSEIEEVGDALYDLFHEIVPGVEPGSIEEAFLDTSAMTWIEAEQAAAMLRERARRELGIAVSVGIGRTKLMAKLGSRAAKPDGLHVIDAAREAELRLTLTPAQIWGVGARTLARLTNLGVKELADLDGVPAAELDLPCGTGMARRLRQIRAGTDDAVVRPVNQRSSFTAEGSTAGYARANKSPQELQEECIAAVCHRADRAGLAGSGLTLTLRLETGTAALTRKIAIAEASAAPQVWLAVGKQLLEREPVPHLSGLGVSLTGLLPLRQVQGALF